MTAVLPYQLDLSVLIPVKDEVESLPLLMDELIRAMNGMPGKTWEAIFIDDGSSDGSWTAMTRLAQQHANVSAHRLRRNFGKAEALAVGTSFAVGAIIVTIDGDLQDDPAEIPQLLAILEKDMDLVSGYKEVRHDPLGKRLPSKVFNAVTGVVTGLKLHDHNCGLKVGRAEVYRSVPLYGELHRYIPAVSHAMGFRVTELPVNHRPRQFGKSKYGVARFTRGFLDLLTVVTLTRFNRRPGHLFGGIGLIFGLIAAVILVYLACLRIFFDGTIGERPLLLLGVLLAVLSVQMISTGLLAEMIVNRTHHGPDLTLSVIESTAVEPATS